MSESPEHEPSSLSPQPYKRPSRPYKRLLSGAAIAIVGVVVAVVPRIGGIDTWKIVLGLFGLALFFGAGREPRN
jgi:hypothetical protein